MMNLKGRKTKKLGKMDDEWKEGKTVDVKLSLLFAILTLHFQTFLNF